MVKTSQPQTIAITSATMIPSSTEKTSVVLEINRLSLKAREAEADVSWWSNAGLVLVALTAAVAVLYGIASFVASRKSQLLSETQKSLLVQKNKLAEIDSAEKSLETLTFFGPLIEEYPGNVEPGSIVIQIGFKPNINVDVPATEEFRKILKQIPIEPK